MQPSNQSGSLLTTILIVLLSLGLIASAGFGYWAYSERQDYKNKSDQKAAVVAAKAVEQEKAKLAKEFEEQAKLPVLTYTGPETYGSVTFNYPKTWDGFVDTTNSGDPIESIYYQGSPPLQNDQDILYALRVELVSSDYTGVIQSFESDIEDGTVKAVAYVPPKMKDIPNVQTGTRLDGEIDNDVQGSMVVIKVRDKTLKISTESPTYLADFNSKVLASLRFVP